MVELADDASVSRPPSTRGLRVGGPHTPEGITRIGRGVVIEGEVKADEDLVIDGKVDGTIELRHHVRRAGASRKKTMTLTATEFIRRMLLHVLPPGFHRIRHYGFLANRNRQQKLTECRRLLCTPPPAAEAGPVATDYRDRYEALTGRSLRRCRPDATTGTCRPLTSPAPGGGVRSSWIRRDKPIDARQPPFAVPGRPRAGRVASPTPPDGCGTAFPVILADRRRPATSMQRPVGRPGAPSADNATPIAERRGSGSVQSGMTSVVLIDIGRPSRAFPVTPPGIRVTYHGGSIGLCIGRRSEFRKSNRVEIAIAQVLPDGRVAGHPPEPGR